jgi:hypothetical protein
MGLNSRLARYAVQSNHLKKSGVINHRLFRPNRERKVSVFRIEDKTHQEKIKEGKRVVREHKDATTLYGWAEIATNEVHDVGLKVLDDDIPPGHSSIIGWPEDEAECRPYQYQLAELATSYRLPQPVQVSG